MPADNFHHLTPGSPYPLGSTLDECGCNFAIYSEHATAVVVCLFDDTDKEIARVPLRERRGSIWHGHIKGITAGQKYNYRLDGPFEPEQGHIFNPCKLVIDPYAKQLDRTLEFHRSLLWLNREGFGEHCSTDSAAFIPKSIVTADDDFIPQPLTQPIDPDQRIIYELHVKGFTQLNRNIPEPKRGKYLGLIEAAVIDHLKQLGITTLQLMPCFSFMSEKRLTELGLSNYWGYNPINFFCPDWRYAIDNPVREFKQMIDGLHAAGFEVILDVVYNHTAEGEMHEAFASFKGIDNRVYYQFTNVLESDKHSGTHYLRYRNDSGCGNTINSAHPQVTQLILDSLRYWAGPMGLDGFRFDLAPVLGRRGDHFDTNAAIFSVIRHDPLLSRKLMVAEPWDIGPNGYQLGNFPDHWLEVNDRYRDAVRAFWRGDKGLLSEFTTRLMGSRDFFNKVSRNCAASVNCIDYHDGFALEDLVSYNHKHNLANGEENRDGHNHNISCNHGEEGPSRDQKILAAREQHKRNLIFTLLFSRGTPHLLGGDELSHSQQGNNNAYCQDNPISWINWNLDARQQSFLNFCQAVIALRQKTYALNRLALADEHYYLNEQHHDLMWLNQNGELLQETDWENPDNHFLALHISEKRALAFDLNHSQPKSEEDREALLIFNAASESKKFKVPSFLPTSECRLDTSGERLKSIKGGDLLEIKASSVGLWVSVSE